MENSAIKNSKYPITNKILLIIGGIGILLLITNCVMFHLLPMPGPLFPNFSPIVWSELKGFVFCLFVIFGGFFRFRKLLIIIILFAPQSFFFGTWAIISGLADYQLLFSDVDALLGTLNILLSVAAILGAFFWWKESKETHIKLKSMNKKFS